jgi:hypothetical protein
MHWGAQAGPGERRNRCARATACLCLPPPSRDVMCAWYYISKPSRTSKKVIFRTALSLQDIHPGGTDWPSAASALGSAGDGDDAGGENGGDGSGGDGGDDARQRESDRGPDRHTYSYATMSVSKRKQRGKKKKAQTVTGGGEAGAAAQSASS